MMDLGAFLQVITQLSPATSAFIADELLGNGARFARASVVYARQNSVTDRMRERVGRPGIASVAESCAVFWSTALMPSLSRIHATSC